jgi:uncharacterized protein YuzE
MIKQTYDLDADALYITLTDHACARTVEIDREHWSICTPSRAYR